MANPARENRDSYLMENERSDVLNSSEPPDAKFHQPRDGFETMSLDQYSTTSVSGSNYKLQQSYYGENRPIENVRSLDWELTPKYFPKSESGISERSSDFLLHNLPESKMEIHEVSPSILHSTLGAGSGEESETLHMPSCTKNMRPVNYYEYVSEVSVPSFLQARPKADYVTSISSQISNIPSKVKGLQDFETQAPKLDANSLGVGKASPYSSQSQDGETDSVDETETESEEDEHQNAEHRYDRFIRSHHLSKQQRDLFVKLMKAFWCTYNKDFRSILSVCVKSITTCTADGSKKSSCSQLQSTSSAAAASMGLSTFGFSRKRKITDGDESPPNERERMPQQPTRNVDSDASKDNLKFACPFRKHNPQKYNMHNSKFNACATKWWPNVARTKGHLYRRHKAEIHCVRCWLYFRSQDELDLHLSATNICDIRPGPRAIEGFRPDIEKRLRCRKNLAKAEADRWVDMYRILFPDEEIPSPFFELILDSPPRFTESMGIPVEEMMRQQIPQEFISRLEMELRLTDLEYGSGLLDDQGHLETRYARLMTRLIREAQHAVISAHITNNFPTPPPSAAVATRSSDMLPNNATPVPLSGSRYAMAQDPFHTVEYDCPPYMDDNPTSQSGNDATLGLDPQENLMCYVNAEVGYESDQLLDAIFEPLGFQ